MGDLSGNLDWLLLQDVIGQTPDLDWVFVGPADRPIPDAAHAAARARVRTLATFVGAKPYGQLQSYARCFHAAVLPYLRREPTYSGSSTRFYEHLAACRPMVATRGFAELLEKEPLLKLADTATEMAATLNHLHLTGFSDNLESDRWQASQSATWERRVDSMREALASGSQTQTVAEAHVTSYSRLVLH